MTERALVAGEKTDGSGTFSIELGFSNHAENSLSNSSFKVVIQLMNRPIEYPKTPKATIASINSIWQIFMNIFFFKRYQEDTKFI
mmetsp:Transcript_26204/g.47970  ORF Transcript_26204/g.47970 Transcript_26204/m.47970 type:complete len:85 (-) Transcript_26204:50-304(-)